MQALFRIFSGFFPIFRPRSGKDGINMSPGASSGSRPVLRPFLFEISRLSGAKPITASAEGSTLRTNGKLRIKTTS